MSVAQTQTVGQTTAQPLSPQASTALESDAEVISSDFETFLLMLTTQLENQDPLNPIESQDFAVQLATFSGVEQQVLTNDLLKELTSALGASELSQLAEWVGKEARVQAPIAFDGRPVDIAIEPELGADRAELVVFDELGRELMREQVPTAAGIYPWVGTSTSGQPLNQGVYSLQLVSSRAGEVLSTKPIEHYSEVIEARQVRDGVELVMDGGTVVSTANVSALRAPDLTSN